MLQAYVKDDFNNLLDYRKWIVDTFQHLSDINMAHSDSFTKERIEQRIERSTSWFGEGANYEDMASGITEYQNPALIEKIFDQVNDKISSQVRDTIKARKIRYNPNGLGVFAFDRAAMGMYRIKEWYSPSLKEVVDVSEVVEKQKRYILKSDNSPVVERWEEKPDGKPKIRTSNKNVYAYFPHVNKEKKAVELFISCGGDANIDAEGFLYSGISAIIVAQILEKARVQTRISIVIGSSPDGFKEKAYAAIIPVKNYDENLDINLLALLTSDPRFFRYEGFKGIISLYDHFKTRVPSGLGNGIGQTTLKMLIEQSTYSQQANLAPNRFYFGWTFDEAGAIDAIKDSIDELDKRLNTA